MSNKISPQLIYEMATAELKKRPEYKHKDIPQHVFEAKVVELTENLYKLTPEQLDAKIQEYLKGQESSKEGWGIFGLEVSDSIVRNNQENLRLIMTPDSEKTRQTADSITKIQHLRSIGFDIEAITTTLTSSEKEALSFMEDMLSDATVTFEQQLKQDNWISGSYNRLIKETFDTAYAKSNIQEALDSTKSDIVDLKSTLDFQTTFEQKRGVKFDPEKVKLTKQKAENMARYQASTDMVKNLKSHLSTALTPIADNQVERSGERAVMQTLSMMGYTNIGEVIQTAMKGHENDPAVKDYMKENGNFAVSRDANGVLGIYRETKEGGYEPITPEMAQIIGEEINLRLNRIYAQSLGIPEKEYNKLNNQELEELTQKRYDELKTDYESTFEATYGKKELKTLAQNYMLSQQEGQAYIQAGFNFTMMGLAMFSGGTTALLATGAMVTDPIGLIAKATDVDGMTKEDWKEYGQGVLEQAGWMALGMGAGKIGDMTRSFVKVKGLSAAFKQSGKSFDDFIKIVNMTDVPQDIAKSLRKVKLMSETLGVTAEVATDLATTYMLQKDGATTTDWIMSITTTIAGTQSFKAIMDKIRLNHSNPSQMIKDIKESFSALDLTDADALKLADEIRKIESEMEIKNAPIENNHEGSTNDLSTSGGNTDSRVDLMSLNEWLDSTNSEDHLRLLADLEDSSGNLLFNIIDINRLLTEMPEGLNIKGKDLLSLMTLKDISVDDALQILSKIDSPEKLELLNVLTDTSNNKYDCIKNNSFPRSNELNYIEIENILENVKDSNITNIGKFFENAIGWNYAKRIPEKLSLSALLTRISYDIKSDYQKDAFHMVMENSSLWYPDYQVSYNDIIDNIIKNIKTQNDVHILANSLDCVSSHLKYNLFLCQMIICENDDMKNFLADVLQRIVLRSDFKDNDIVLIGTTFSTLINRRNNKNLTDDTILKMVDAQVSLDDIDTLVQNSSSDSSHIIYERMKNDQFDYDLGSLVDISYSNDFQKGAFTALLDNNQNRRFEALAFQNILNYVNDENSLKLLNELLENENIDPYSIIESLKQGRIVDITHVKLKNDKSTINVAKAEQEIAQMIGLNDPNITSDIRNAISCYLENLVKLNSASPKRFKKMIDCGVFDLIKEGKISVDVLKNIDNNTFLSNRTLNDIKKIKEGKSAITTLSSQKDLDDISRHIPNGDVCEFNGKLYVNENGTATEIKLSKEKFEELFPLLTSVSFEQGRLGDCWLVSTLDNFMDLPNGRISLYKLFEQQGDDILIKFPNGTNPIKFEKGVVLNAQGYQISGIDSGIPLGIQMIEQAYAIHRYSNYDSNAEFTEISSHLTNVAGLMEELRGGWQYEASREILGNYLAATDSYGINLGNREKMKEYIELYANDENVLTFFSTRDIPGGDSSMLSSKYDLAGSHAYSIKGYNKDTGMVYITNPWHTSVITEVPLYELMKYIDDVNIANLN